MNLNIKLGGNFMKKTYIGILKDEGVGGQEVKVIGQISSSSSFEHPLFHVCKHSPDGFNWGYGGSGPADLSLSILTDYYGNNTSPVNCYQDFKQSVIASLPQGEGFTLESEVIDAWWERCCNSF